MDVKDVLYGRENAPLVVGGRYGLSSKDTTPAQILSVFENLELPEPKNGFTIGIVDDVTFKSLPVLPELNFADNDMFAAKFYGLGADGTVGANKNSVKIIGDNTDKYCQAYFEYDSKRAAVSHAPPKVRQQSDTLHVSCQHTQLRGLPRMQAYLHYRIDVTRGLRKGGTFLLNTIREGDELAKNTPNKIKRYLAENDITLYYINASKIAQEIGPGNRTNTILQSAFFRITNVIPVDLAVEQMKKFIVKSYSNKGQNVVDT